MLSVAELEKLSEYLREPLKAGHVRVDQCARIHGGASRETYALDVTIDGAPRGLILRRDPEDSLIDTERALEFAAYQTFESIAPVPKTVALVADGSVLGRPFFIMERIEGGSAASPFALAPYAPHTEAIGEQFFKTLGQIHAVTPEGTPLARVVDSPPPSECWRRELDHWERVIEQDTQEPQPIVRAALRRLRRAPPPAPKRLAVVHGDYRTGNFLHDGAGNILAILDWEMAHIGDPLEDLAWAMDPLWCNGARDLAAGMIAKHDAIALWKRESGFAFDAASFEWWSLFASVKGMAIWISSAKAFADGKNNDPVLSASAYLCSLRHNQIIASRLAGAPYGGLS
jgi:aminoglycoside phosphotransferase (APT) family kinase protein